MMAKGCTSAWKMRTTLTEGLVSNQKGMILVVEQGSYYQEAQV